MSPRVLIVDDDPELLRGIQHRLHRMFDVQTASSAEAFETYNDTYGHLAGDHALESIATTIRGACRGSDEAFRYGGEDIVLLLPDTPQHGLLTGCERFRHQIEDLQIAHRNHSPPQITISIGASGYDCLEPIRAEDVLQRGARALCQSEADGRNRVTLPQPGHHQRQ